MLNERRARRLPFSAALLVVLANAASCAKRPNPPGVFGPDPPRIEVDAWIAKEEAIERTMQAFGSEGLIIASSNGGVIRSETLAVKSRGFTVGRAYYLATVSTRSDGRSQIVVSAMMEDVHHGLGQGSASGQATEATDSGAAPIRSSFEKMYIPLWQQLGRIAARIIKGHAAAPR